MKKFKTLNELLNYTSDQEWSNDKEQNNLKMEVKIMLNCFGNNLSPAISDCGSYMDDGEVFKKMDIHLFKGKKLICSSGYAYNITKK